MVYEQINGTMMGSNLAYIFVYANQVTHQWFGFIMVLAFYLVVLLGSVFMQLRFTARIRAEVSFLASSFATLGFATILQQISGILSPVYFFMLIGITILSVLWVAISSN